MPRLNIIAATAVAALAIAACSSADTVSPAAPASTSPSTSTSAIASSSTASTETATPVPSVTPSAHVDPDWSFSPNWKAIAHEMRKNFHGLCVMYVCSGWDDTTGAEILITKGLNESDPTQIKFKVTLKTLDDKITASLLLSKWAMYFSTDNASQFDFAGFVDNNFEELATGHHVQANLDFIPIRLARTDPREWILTVGTE